MAFEFKSWKSWKGSWNPNSLALATVLTPDTGKNPTGSVVSVHSVLPAFHVQHPIRHRLFFSCNPPNMKCSEAQSRLDPLSYPAGSHTYPHRPVKTGAKRTIKPENGHLSISTIQYARADDDGDGRRCFGPIDAQRPSRRSVRSSPNVAMVAIAA